MDVAYPLSSDAVKNGFGADLLTIYLGDGAGNFTQGQTVTIRLEQRLYLDG